LKRWAILYIWFIKESFSFMRGYNRAYILFSSIIKGFGFASNTLAYERLTPQQRENWYLSGEGRTIRF
jgi:hypothetical protein